MADMRRLKNDLIYVGIRVLIFVLQSLPRDLALKLAGMIGEIAAILDMKERELAERNLRQAYGGTWSETRIKLVARECFVKIARNACDVIRSRGWTTKRLKELVDTEGMEHFDHAFAGGKGVVAITGHIGNFELLAAWFSSVKNVPLSVIGRRLYDDRLDRLVVENRERFGTENIPSDAPARRVYATLKAGRMLGVLMDLDSSRVSGYFVPFFGRLARTAVGPIAIGRRTASPVVPMAMFRKDNDRFLIKVLPSFDIPVTDNKEADIEQALRRCNSALEELINYDPTQWIWIHDRWRSQPEKTVESKSELKEVGLSENQR